MDNGVATFRNDHLKTIYVLIFEGFTQRPASSLSYHFPVRVILYKGVEVQQSRLRFRCC